MPLQSFSSKGSNQLLKKQIGVILLPPPDSCLRIRTRASRQGLRLLCPCLWSLRGRGLHSFPVPYTSGDAGAKSGRGLPPFSTDDLAKGTGADLDYRYIKPLQDARGKKVTSISWGTNSAVGPQTTGDINRGRGGRNLSLDWSYD